MNDMIGFIGCGNMGGALIRAAAKAIDPAQILITDAACEKATNLAAETGTIETDIDTLSRSCKYIFLGVKPQGMGAMLTQIKDILASRTDRFVLISMAAGTTVEKIRSMVGNYPMIRIMPNLPVSVGEGMILYCAYDVFAEEEATFLSAMRCAGKLCRMEEKMIDAGSAVSGCGPAFVCLFAEALADGGVRCGLNRTEANLMAAQTLLGTAKQLLETGIHPGILKDAVCSPGGTTIEGVIALEKGSFRADAAGAVIAAYEKTKKL